jgi:hypothetical protein
MKVQDAITKLKMASGILLDNAELKQYQKSSYREIKSRGSVREAWENVGKCFRAVFEEIESEDE